MTGLEFLPHDAPARNKRRGLVGLVANLKEKDPHYVPPTNITLEELQRFFIVQLEERQGKNFYERTERRCIA